MTENTPSDALVEAMARAMCAADGLDWDEQCGYEAGPFADECASGTCVAALSEDHDPDDCRDWYRRHAQVAAAVIAEEMTANDAELQQAVGMIEDRNYELVERDARIRVLEDSGRNILPYLDWTIGPESPGYHPTMPSAVDAFRAALGSAKK